MKVRSISNDIFRAEDHWYLSNQDSCDAKFDILVPQNDVEKELLRSLVYSHVEQVLDTFPQRVVYAPVVWEVSDDGVAKVKFTVEVDGMYHEQRFSTVVDPDGSVLPQQFGWRETAKKEL